MWRSPFLSGGVIPFTLLDEYLKANDPPFTRRPTPHDKEN